MHLQVCVRDEEQNFIAINGLLYASILSLFGSSFMLCSFFTFGKFKNPLTKLIAYLSLCDFAWACTEIVRANILLTTHTHSMTTCVVFRLLYQFFASASVFWTCCISFFLYLYIRSPQMVQRNTKLMHAIFHLCCWSIPILVGAIMLYKKVFTLDPVMACYPKEPYHSILWFGPNFIAILAVGTNYLLIHIHIKKSSQLPMRAGKKLPFHYRTSLYLLVLIVCWTLDFVVQFSVWARYCLPFPVDVAYVTLLQMQGVLDSVVYGLFTASVRKHYVRLGPIRTVLWILFAPLLVIPTFLYFLKRIASPDHLASPEQEQRDKLLNQPVPTYQSGLN